MLILAVLVAVAYALENADPAAHGLAIADETGDLELLPSDLTTDEKKYKIYYRRKYKYKKKKKGNPFFFKYCQFLLNCLFTGGYRSSGYGGGGGGGGGSSEEGR
jgi:hypothetical protein